MTFAEIMLHYIISNASCLLISPHIPYRKKYLNHTTKLHKLSGTNQTYACIVDKASVKKKTKPVDK